MTTTEAFQNLLIDSLSANAKLAPLAEAGQIRAVTDQADPKIGPAAIVVDVTDKGAHLGLPGRILLDFDAAVSVRTSLADDVDCSAYNTLIQGVEETLAALPIDTAQTGGFTILHASAWHYAGLEVDGFYRYNSLTATFLILNNPPNTP